MCLSRFGLSVVFEASCAHLLRPKSVPIRYTALMDSKKACPNSQEIIGIVLTDWKINWTETSLNHQEILGAASANFTHVWKLADLD